ncbi:MAG: hypothetical protein EBE86_020850 [Hormoscilla sp. GUM202]|nr:hypothetical protein [Hormoscilla sp. GUM202]
MRDSRSSIPPRNDNFFLVKKAQFLTVGSIARGKGAIARQIPKQNYKMTSQTPTSKTLTAFVLADRHLMAGKSAAA